LKHLKEEESRVGGLWTATGSFEAPEISTQILHNMQESGDVPYVNHKNGQKTQSVVSDKSSSDIHRKITTDIPDSQQQPSRNFATQGSKQLKKKAEQLKAQVQREKRELAALTKNRDNLQTHLNEYVQREGTTKNYLDKLSKRRTYVEKIKTLNRLYRNIADMETAIRNDEAQLAALEKAVVEEAALEEEAGSNLEQPNLESGAADIGTKTAMILSGAAAESAMAVDANGSQDVGGGQDTDNKRQDNGTKTQNNHNENIENGEHLTSELSLKTQNQIKILENRIKRNEVTLADYQYDQKQLFAGETPSVGTSVTRNKRKLRSLIHHMVRDIGKDKDEITRLISEDQQINARIQNRIRGLYIKSIIKTASWEPDHFFKNKDENAAFEHFLKENQDEILAMLRSDPSHFESSDLENLRHFEILGNGLVKIDRSGPGRGGFVGNDRDAVTESFPDGLECRSVMHMSPPNSMQPSPVYSIQPSPLSSIQPSPALSKQPSPMLSMQHSPIDSQYSHDEDEASDAISDGWIDLKDIDLEHAANLAESERGTDRIDVERKSNDMGRWSDAAERTSNAGKTVLTLNDAIGDAFGSSDTAQLGNTPQLGISINQVHAPELVGHDIKPGSFVPIQVTLADSLGDRREVTLADRLADPRETGAVQSPVAGTPWSFPPCPLSSTMPDSSQFSVPESSTQFCKPVFQNTYTAAISAEPVAGADSVAGGEQKDLGAADAKNDTNDVLHMSRKGNGASSFGKPSIPGAAFLNCTSVLKCISSIVPLHNASNSANSLHSASSSSQPESHGDSENLRPVESSPIIVNETTKLLLDSLREHTRKEQLSRLQQPRIWRQNDQNSITKRTIHYDFNKKPEFLLSWIKKSLLAELELEILLIAKALSSFLTIHTNGIGTLLNKSSTMHTLKANLSPKDDAEQAETSQLEKMEIADEETKEARIVDIHNSFKRIHDKIRESYLTMAELVGSDKFRWAIQKIPQNSRTQFENSGTSNSGTTVREQLLRYGHKVPVEGYGSVNSGVPGSSSDFKHRDDHTTGFSKNLPDITIPAASVKVTTDNSNIRSHTLSLKNDIPNLRVEVLDHVISYMQEKYIDSRPETRHMPNIFDFFYDKAPTETQNGFLLRKAAETQRKAANAAAHRNGYFGNYFVSEISDFTTLHIEPDSDFWTDTQKVFNRAVPRPMSLNVTTSNDFSLYLDYIQTFVLCESMTRSHSPRSHSPLGVGAETIRTEGRGDCNLESDLTKSDATAAESPDISEPSEWGPRQSRSENLNGKSANTGALHTDASRQPGFEIFFQQVMRLSHTIAQRIAFWKIAQWVKEKRIEIQKTKQERTQELSASILEYVTASLVSRIEPLPTQIGGGGPGGYQERSSSSMPASNSVLMPVFSDDLQYKMEMAIQTLNFDTDSERSKNFVDSFLLLESTSSIEAGEFWPQIPNIHRNMETLIDNWTQAQSVVTGMSESDEGGVVKLRLTRLVFEDKAQALLSHYIQQVKWEAEQDRLADAQSKVILDLKSLHSQLQEKVFAGTGFQSGVADLRGMDLRGAETIDMDEDSEYDDSESSSAMSVDSTADNNVDNQLYNPTSNQVPGHQSADLRTLILSTGLLGIRGMRIENQKLLPAERHDYQVLGSLQVNPLNNGLLGPLQQRGAQVFDSVPHRKTEEAKRAMKSAHGIKSARAMKLAESQETRAKSAELKAQINDKWGGFAFLDHRKVILGGENETPELKFATNENYQTPTAKSSHQTPTAKSGISIHQTAAAQHNDSGDSGVRGPTTQYSSGVRNPTTQQNDNSFFVTSQESQKMESKRLEINLKLAHFTPFERLFLNIGATFLSLALTLLKLPFEKEGETLDVRSRWEKINAESGVATVQPMPAHLKFQIHHLVQQGRIAIFYWKTCVEIVVRSMVKGLLAEKLRIESGRGQKASSDRGKVASESASASRNSENLLSAFASEALENAENEAKLRFKVDYIPPGGPAGTGSYSLPVTASYSLPVTVSTFAFLCDLCGRLPDSDSGKNSDSCSNRMRFLSRYRFPWMYFS